MRMVPPLTMNPLGRAFVLSAATLGTLELAIDRVAAPILAHIPRDAAAPLVAEVASFLGQRALAATALLVALAALVVAATPRPDGWGSRVADAAVGATALLTAATDASLAALTMHVAVVCAAIVVGVRVRSAGVVLAAAAVAMGQIPLALDRVADVLAVAAPSTNVALLTAAEAALMLAPIALAVELVRRESPSTLAWSVALLGGLAVSAALARSPSYVAITSLWATGVTLSLSPVLYVIAAACAALVMTTWLSRPATRHLAAGLALLVVAGPQPAVVHHNLTAVLALVLLASPPLAGRAASLDESLEAPPVRQPAALGATG